MVQKINRSRIDQLLRIGTEGHGLCVCMVCFPWCTFVKCHLDLATPDKTVCSAGVRETRSEAEQTAGSRQETGKHSDVFMLFGFVLYLFFGANT